LFFFVHCRFFFLTHLVSFFLYIIDKRKKNQTQHNNNKTDEVDGRKKNLYTNNVTKHDREEETNKNKNHKYIHTLQTTKKHCAALTGTEEKAEEKKNQNRYRRAICPIEEFE